MAQEPQDFSPRRIGKRFEDSVHNV